MKMLISLLLAVTLMPLGGLAAAESNAEDTDDVCPVIVIDEVPASDAIRNLANQLNLNLILDPRVPGSGFKPGNAFSDPEVSIRCTNCEVSRTLSLVLARNKLKLITNAAVTVVRVVPASDPPLPPAPVAIAGSETNKLVPKIVLDGFTLREALETLASLIQLKLTFDPAFSLSAVGNRDSVLRVRWRNMSPRQALSALCDNYGLRMVEDPSGSTAKVFLAAPNSAPSGKSRFDSNSR